VAVTKMAHAFFSGFYQSHFLDKIISIIQWISFQNTTISMRVHHSFRARHPVSQVDHRQIFKDKEALHRAAAPAVGTRKILVDHHKAVATEVVTTAVVDTIIKV
jgi:hypothetical protein